MPPRKSSVVGHSHKPPLTLEEIRSWAEQFYNRCGEWPVATSGPIPGTRETWSCVVGALCAGCRGLPHGNTLSRLLDGWFPELRPRRRQGQFLTIEKIVQWAREHHRQTGRWPTSESGQVLGHPDEKWSRIGAALYIGSRGLPGGDTLARLLQRSVLGHSRLKKRKLTLAQIRSWARAHRARCGKWPIGASGKVVGGDGTTWWAVYIALRYGYRGLPGGMSLREVLGLSHRQRRPRLTIKQILAWADEHHERTGSWPVAGTVFVPHLRPQTNWQVVNSALKHGTRGLPGGSTLAELLAKRRGVPLDRRFHLAPVVGRNRSAVLKLSVGEILAYVDQYRKKTGKWPAARSSPVEGLPNVHWSTIDRALKRGAWGLPAGGSLKRLLVEQRGARLYGMLPPLTEEQILEWADAFYARQGRWPSSNAGPIPEAPGETWNTVYFALRNGLRGMSGSTNLGVFLARHKRRLKWVRQGSVKE